MTILSIRNFLENLSSTYALQSNIVPRRIVIWLVKTQPVILLKFIAIVTIGTVSDVVDHLTSQSAVFSFKNGAAKLKVARWKIKPL